MTDEQQNNGELLLPVCIPEDDIKDVLSALDLYRVLRKSGKSYPAFNAIINALPFIANPQDSPCLDIEASGTGGFNCETFDTYSEAMHFYPNDPFQSDVHEINLFTQWARYGDVLGMVEVPEWLEIMRDTLALDLFGYEENDVILIPDIRYSINPIKQLENFLDSYTNFPLPTVTIITEGAGTIGIEFLNVPLGGRALVLRDIDLTLQEIHEVLTDTVTEGNEGIFNSFSLVELNRDLLSIPQETASTQIQEYEFEEDDVNTIRIIFIPAFNDEAPFLFPFGGIRSFRACGNVKVKNFSTGELTTRFKNREGVISVATYEDLRRAVHHGTIDAWADAVAGRGDGVTSNFESGIAIGKDGEITIQKNLGSGAPAPVVDASNEELLYGGAYRQAQGIADLFSRIETLSTNNYGDTAMINVLNLLLGYNGAGLALILGNYNASPTNIVIDVEALASQIYCNGVQLGIIEYAIQEVNNSPRHTTDETDYLVQFVSEIPSVKLSDWYEAGTAIPNAGYTTSECYRFDNVEFDIVAGSDASSTTVILGQPSFINSRDYRVEVSGELTNGAGDKYDGYYIKQTNGANVYNSLSLIVAPTGSNSFSTPYYLATTQPAQNASPSDLYRVNYRLVKTGSYRLYGVATHGNFWGNGVTGSLNVKLIDLGDLS